MHKIVQCKLQSSLEKEMPDVHAVLRKGWGTRDAVANWKSQRVKKKSISA